MADEEQFSLCWNNFNTNLSAGFHESLCRGDLVDVTLAAEGQLVKAHRLVLSVCSPYFRKMFTQMPANQHAFVFLKDVSSSALKDLIQFMYCGEVNVKQEALPAFISTAEALQIKGLTESNDGTVTAQGSSSPTKEGNVSTPLPDQSSLRPRSTRIVASRPQAFKIESEGSSDEKQTVTLVQTTQPSKRSSRQSITVAPKRIKMSQSQESADPLDDPEHEIVTPQHLKVTEATEFIDLPIEGTQLNPKTEPEYVEDTQEIETEQDDDQYVEDVTYGEEKYDESYFTEGDDKAGVSGFSETYATEGDQSNTDAQDDINFVNIIDYTSNSYKSQKPTTSRRAEDEIRSLKRQLARIQDEFRRIKSPSGTFNRGLTISKMKIPRDISFVPPPINDVKDLDRFEEQLKKYNKNPSLVDREFTILREKLVNYYSKKIYNQEVRTSPKNALAASFMKMYFADEFQNRIGWTEYENRVPLKKYSGHIMFVFDIVNKRRPETYATYEDAAAAIYNYQRRYHESINALKRVKKTDAL